MVRAAVPEGVELDRTVFYAASGGQPGDTGRIAFAGGEAGGHRHVHPDGDRAASCTCRPGRHCRRPGRRCGWRSTGSGGTG